MSTPETSEAFTARLERTRMTAIFEKLILGKVMELKGMNVNDIPADAFDKLIHHIDAIGAITVEIKTRT